MDGIKKLKLKIKNNSTILKIISLNYIISTLFVTFSMKYGIIYINRNIKRIKLLRKEKSHLKNIEIYKSNPKKLRVTHVHQYPKKSNFIIAFSTPTNTQLQLLLIKSITL